MCILYTYIYIYTYRWLYVYILVDMYGRHIPYNWRKDLTLFDHTIYIDAYSIYTYTSWKSGGSWMYPDPNEGPLWEIPIFKPQKSGYLWVFSSPRIPSDKPCPCPSIPRIGWARKPQNGDGGSGGMFSESWWNHPGRLHIWMFPKIGGYPKMDGENNGKPYFLMDDLGVPLFLETPIYGVYICHVYLYMLVHFQE